ncbi:nucleoside-diphosphate-sugar epimerases [Vibrio ishigakensis]|uniref:Nucleoside-diphosphate-sugar epimerases n=2 Tax=Vibrio ishigakensis TaxID=1481914 RepID=A0A0B8NU61_9VIBR|nr:nucleoside-diphosphate-sugar epimerases [Vibrio ishigakensis]
MNTSIVIAGATGLVGRETLEALLQDVRVAQVISLSRRKIEMEHSRLQQWITADLSKPKSPLMNVQPSVGIITLGTTLKKAGSKENLRAIDVDLVVNTATKMKKMGVERLYVVSCLGANTKAMSHYLQCKGEMEAQIEALGFTGTTFMQPGPLAGNRDEQRTDEKLLQGAMKLISPLMIGKLKNYVPIEAKLVAKAINRLVFMNQESRVSRVTSQKMRVLAA